MWSEARTNNCRTVKVWRVGNYRGDKNMVQEGRPRFGQEPGCRTPFKRQSCTILGKRKTRIKYRCSQLANTCKRSDRVPLWIG